MVRNALAVAALSGVFATGCLWHAAKPWLEEPLPHNQSHVWDIRAVHAGDLRVRVGDSLNLVLLRTHCYEDKNGCWADEDSSVVVKWEVLDKNRARVSPLPRGAWRFGPGSAGGRLYGISPGKVRVRVRLPQGTIVDTAEVTLEPVTLDTAYTHGDSTPAAYCARREAAIESRTGGSGYYLAFNAIQDCPNGPRVLAEQWASPPSDSVALRLLGQVGANVLDQRVFDAARAVVANEGARRDVRLAAMDVLVGHYDPCLSLWIQVKSLPDAAGHSVVVWLLQSEHNLRRRGSEPLPSSVRDDVLATLDAAAASGPDSVVHEAARRLAARLRAFHWPGKRCG